MKKTVTLEQLKERANVAFNTRNDEELNRVLESIKEYYKSHPEENLEEETEETEEEKFEKELEEEERLAREEEFGKDWFKQDWEDSGMTWADFI